MTGSTSHPTNPRKALLFGLDEALAASLKQVLSHCNCKAFFVQNRLPDQERPARADIVFCPSSPDMLHRALELFRGLPVVVVSRLPEVEGWLNALEDGAADYCAAPFEPIQLRWLLETHTRPRKAFAA
jgi:DNA-binding response OmpR family regulator